MAKLQKGTTFVDGNSYNAAALNSLVDSATILPGAITEQTAGGSPANSDQFMFYSASASALRQCSLSDLVAAFPANGASGIATLRSLGTVATAAAAGNDGRFPANVTGLRLGAGGGGADLAAGPKNLSFPTVNLAAGLNLNWDLCDVFYDNSVTGSANRTYTFSNVRDGRVILLLINLASYTGTITWPSLYGTVPAQTNGINNLYMFFNTPFGTSGVVRTL